MKHWRFALVALILCGIWTASRAEIIGGGVYGVFKPSASGCSQATAAIARLDSTQNAAHNTAYTTLICNLVTQGVWAKLDIMHVYATNDSANALTNLVQSSFGGTTHGAPTFTTDRGFTGVDASTTVYIDLGFNPSTAVSAQYALNAEHLSAWVNTNATASASGGVVIGALGTISMDNLFPKYSDGNAYYRAGDVRTSASAGVANANSTGHYLANRSNAVGQQGYKNAVDQSVVSAASGSIVDVNITALARGTGAAVDLGGGYQVMADTVGGSLSAGDVVHLCHELNSYLTTIASVAGGIC